MGCAREQGVSITRVYAVTGKVRGGLKYVNTGKFQNMELKGRVQQNHMKCSRGQLIT